MPSELRFDGRVAVVTGAGNGLGRSHALLLASRGAKVVVNDLGGSAHGEGRSSSAADAVVAEIKAAGGEAVPSYDSVEDGGKIVQCALDSFGRIDILINNAGILRDVSFQKMSEQDWDIIYRVHVLGAYRTTAAAWNHMREAGFGRIIFTASAAGIYGNFGQANYSMAKLGLVGFAGSLAIEGKKKGVLVNTIAPIAGSRMTETVLPRELTGALKPEYVSPLVAYLSHESCAETGGLFEVGGGFCGKLRWERAAGHTFKLSRPMTIEGVRDRFSAITGFDKTTHPADITAALKPVLDNLGTAKGKGGNEFIDVDEALGYEFPAAEGRYDERDLALYALGVGAGQDPLSEQDLSLVYELNGKGFHALPSYMAAQAVAAVIKLAAEGQQAPGLHYGLDRVLHGEQYTEIRRPLPSKAKLTHKIKVKDIFDKGKGAVVITSVSTTDEGGRELCYNEVSTFVRGAGGWGGDRGPSADVNVAPERAPDAVVEERTRPDQALLYRLSGDWNPLHADPAFAKAFGFERPILHGLCTFGFVTRHVIARFAGGDPRLFKSIKVRFAESVLPGETIVTEMWKEADGRVIVRAKVKERDKVVISNAAVELHTEVPREESRPAAQAAPAQQAPQSLEPSSGDIFAVIEAYLAKNPGLAGKISTVFQWKLSGPDSAWVLDLKNGSGSVQPGVADKADVTLELSEADFLAMTTGKADPQKLYFGGKLKIAGNVMASQKLEFLKKMDPADAMKIIAARRGGSAPAPAATADPAPGPSASPASPATPAAREAKSPAIFQALSDRLGKNPGLAAEVGALLQFHVRSPDRSFVVDLRQAPGSVREGTDAAAQAAITLSDEDLATLCADPTKEKDLFMHSKLRIDGDVRVGQRLAFLKQLG